MSGEPGNEPLYDDKLAKILRTAIDPRTDEGTRIAALNGAAAYLAGRAVELESLVVLYEGQKEFGISDLYRSLCKRADAAEAEQHVALKAMRRYRKRLGALEGAFKRMKRILRNIDKLDEGDPLLVAETDISPDPEAER